MPRIGPHRFGSLEVVDSGLREPTSRNAFVVMKRRARSRIESLVRTKGGHRGVARYLHSVRNDIAHGKTSVRVFDHGATVADVGRDVQILKLLARLAIEGRPPPRIPDLTGLPGRHRASSGIGARFPRAASAHPCSLSSMPLAKRRSSHSCRQDHLDRRL